MKVSEVAHIPHPSMYSKMKRGHTQVLLVDLQHQAGQSQKIILIIMAA